MQDQKQDTQRLSRAEALQEVRKILKAGSVRKALAYLNHRTPHRFTALYRFNNGTRETIYFYDRENPEAESSPDVPALATYCVFVRDTERPMTVSDAAQDARLAEHPARHEVRSYVGVPLVDELGHIFGTICHFDFDPTPVSDEDVALLEAIAPLLKAGRPTLQP